MGGGGVREDLAVKQSRLARAGCQSSTKDVQEHSYPGNGASQLQSTTPRTATLMVVSYTAAAMPGPEGVCTWTSMTWRTWTMAVASTQRIGVRTQRRNFFLSARGRRRWLPLHNSTCVHGGRRFPWTTWCTTTASSRRLSVRARRRFPLGNSACARRRLFSLDDSAKISYREFLFTKTTISHFSQNAYSWLCKNQISLIHVYVAGPSMA